MYKVLVTTFLVQCEGGASVRKIIIEFNSFTMADTAVKNINTNQHLSISNGNAFQQAIKLY